MSGLDIEAIRERAQKFEDLGAELSPSNYRIVTIAARSAGDVPLLLAQIERERAALDEALATVREQAAEIERLKTADTIVRADLTLAHADIREARVELKRVRGWNDELKGERDDLAQRCLQHEAEMREAGAEIRDAQAATADALQVIADLRGGTT